MADVSHEIQNYLVSGSFFLANSIFSVSKTAIIIPIPTKSFVSWAGLAKVENPLFAPKRRNAIKAIAAMANGPVSAPTSAVRPLFSED